MMAARREHNPAQRHGKSPPPPKKDESSPFGCLPARLHPRLSRVIPLHKFGAYRRLLQLARSCWWTHGALTTMGFRQKRQTRPPSTGPRNFYFQSRQGGVWQWSVCKVCLGVRERIPVGWFQESFALIKSRRCRRRWLNSVISPKN